MKRFIMVYVNDWRMALVPADFADDTACCPMFRFVLTISLYRTSRRNAD